MLRLKSAVFHTVVNIRDGHSKSHRLYSTRGRAPMSADLTADRLVNKYRREGHIHANINPLHEPKTINSLDESFQITDSLLNLPFPLNQLSSPIYLPSNVHKPTFNDVIQHLKRSYLLNLLK